MSTSRHTYLEQRRAAFREVLRERKLDAYLLTHLSDLFYFTDYKSEGYYALISQDNAWLFLPNLLYEQAKATTQGFECLKGAFFPALKDVLKRNKLTRIGFDPAQLSHGFGTALE